MNMSRSLLRPSRDGLRTADVRERSLQRLKPFREISESELFVLRDPNDLAIASNEVIRYRVAFAPGPLCRGLAQDLLAVIQALLENIERPVPNRRLPGAI